MFLARSCCACYNIFVKIYRARIGLSTDSITRRSFDKYIITWWWPGLLVALWSR